MPRTRNPYPAEFREQLVALARAGRSVESLAREYEPCAATIHDWVKQAGTTLRAGIQLWVTSHPSTTKGLPLKGWNL